MLKACIIGTGRIGSSLEKDPLRYQGCTHAGAYTQAHGVELIAGADIDRKALKAFGADWDLPQKHLYTDYREMLDHEKPDIVSIAAYAPERMRMSLEALQAGAKGLWLEKAVGCSIAEAESIRDALSEAGAVAVVDYPRRGRSGYRTIKRLIDTEQFGRLQTVTCHMSPELIHTGTHAFDVLRFWCGEALEVQGRLENNARQTEASISDRGGSAEIRMSSGAVAFVSAYRKSYYIFQFDIVFDKARILIGNDIRKLYLPDTSRNYTGYKELFETKEFTWDRPYPRDMVAELKHSMNTACKPLFSIENAIESLKIALSIFESDKRGGEWVRPNSLDTRLRVESV